MAQVERQIGQVKAIIATKHIFHLEVCAMANNLSD
jgi:hypothetical protein